MKTLLGTWLSLGTGLSERELSWLGLVSEKLNRVFYNSYLYMGEVCLRS